MIEPTWNTSLEAESELLATAEPAPAQTFSATPAPAAAGAKSGKAVFAGYTASQLLLGLAVIALLVWAMWVSRAITMPPQRIVKANLSGIVGDYVQAQARSANPPQEVETQMRAFMASLDSELQRRSAAGEVILVGEAVLSKGVEDITPQVMKAVYASGVKRPEPASAEQMVRSAGQGPIPQVPVPPPASAPAPAGAFGPMPDAGVAAPAPIGEPAPAGANVSSFGGPYGAVGQ